MSPRHVTGDYHIPNMFESRLDFAHHYRVHRAAAGCGVTSLALVHVLVNALGSLRFTSQPGITRLWQGVTGRARDARVCGACALRPPSLLARAFRPIPPHILVPLFETIAALFHVGTLAGALTRIVHPRGRALLGRQRAAAARHVLHDGVRRARLLVRLRVVYSDGNVSDGGLGGHAGALVLVLAEADAALDPHGARADLLMRSSDFQVFEDLFRFSAFGLFNNVSTFTFIVTRACHFPRHRYDIILSSFGLYVSLLNNDKI